MIDKKPGQDDTSGTTDPDDLPDGSGPADDTTSGGDDDQFQG